MNTAFKFMIVALFIILAGNMEMHKLSFVPNFWQEG